MGPHGHRGFVGLPGPPVSARASDSGTRAARVPAGPEGLWGRRGPRGSWVTALLGAALGFLSGPRCPGQAGRHLRILGLRGRGGGPQMFVGLEARARPLLVWRASDPWTIALRWRPLA
jgi:hypothetical protein